jgi:hypothetical protein
MIDNPRLRLLVGEYGRPLVGVLLALSLASFALAGFLYLSPPTDTVSQEVHQREITTSASTSAEVVADDSLWPAGTVLEDRPVYLLNATRELDLVAETTVDGSDRAVVDHEWQLTVRASREGRVFWSETDILANGTSEGAVARSTASLDMHELRDRIEDVQERIGGAGIVSANLTLVVAYDTDPDAEYGYQRGQRLTTRVDVREESLALGAGLADASDSPSTTATTEVTAPRDRLQLSLLGLLGLLALAGAAVVSREEPESIDVEAARNELHRRRYADWISPGVLPDGLEQEFVEVDTLEDVVDVAIDTEERVIHDTRRDVFAVISENVVYYYGTEGTWAESVFPAFTLPGQDGEAGPGPELGDDGEFGPEPDLSGGENDDRPDGDD